MNVAPIRELLTRVAWGDRQACWNEIERRDRELQTLRAQASTSRDATAASTEAVADPKKETHD